MYKDDALTRYTRAAGQEIMMHVMAQPQGARSDVVRAALESIKPGLHAKVDRMAGRIAAGGISTLMAYQEALRLALADVFMESIKALGRAKTGGRVDDAALDAQRLFYGDPDPQGVAGLSGDLGLGNAAKDAANFGLNLMRAAACSPEVRDAIMGEINNESARSGVNAGLAVAKTVAQCGNLPGATPPPGPAAAPPPPPPPPPKDNTVMYLAIGGAVIGLGAIAFFALRK